MSFGKDEKIYSSDLIYRPPNGSRPGVPDSSIYSHGVPCSPPVYTRIDNPDGSMVYPLLDPCIPPKEDISEFIQKMYDDIRSIEKRVNSIETHMACLENEINDYSD